MNILIEGLGLCALLFLFCLIGIQNGAVGHTKAWEIPGTEDLKPYIPFKIHLKKWITMLILYPAVAAILSGIMALILKA